MPRTVSANTHRTTAVVVGLLFLSSTITFAIGNAMLRAALSSDPVDTTALLIGVAGQAYTAVAVAGIGLAMLPVLTPYTPRAARSYLFLRCLECVTILAVGGSMLISRRLIEQYEVPIYIASGAAGIALCSALSRSGLTPLTLARLGMLGYPVLLLGALAALLDLADLNTPAGMTFFVPGAVFEIALPVLLITKGFRAPAGGNPARSAEHGPARQAPESTISDTPR